MSAPLLRTASAAEVALMLDWAAAEGWNPGLEDAEAFHASDPEGFFVAEVAGRTVAAISVVNHGPDFAFLGLYLCQPAFRGKGIGYALWRHALDHAGTRTVGLDGVPAQEANYARSGFVLTGRTLRFKGRVSGAGPSLLQAAPEQSQRSAQAAVPRDGTGPEGPAAPEDAGAQAVPAVPGDSAGRAKSQAQEDAARWVPDGLEGAAVQVAPALPRDATALARLDRAANGVARRAFLAAWLSPRETRQTVVLRRDGAVTGFATARLCREGCKVGPVVAATAEEAFQLMSEAAAAVGAEDVMIDVPSGNADLIRRLEALGFAEVFSTARMYRGDPPETGPCLQAIATMELG